MNLVARFISCEKWKVSKFTFYLIFGNCFAYLYRNCNYNLVFFLLEFVSFLVRSSGIFLPCLQLVSWLSCEKNVRLDISFRWLQPNRVEPTKFITKTFIPIRGHFARRTMLEPCAPSIFHIAFIVYSIRIASHCVFGRNTLSAEMYKQRDEFMSTAAIIYYRCSPVKCPADIYIEEAVTFI